MPGTGHSHFDSSLHRRRTTLYVFIVVWRTITSKYRFTIHFLDDRVTVCSPPRRHHSTSIDRIYSTPLVKLLSHTVSRLNSALHPSPHLDINDIIHLSDMCAFDSQARGTDWRGWSPWCGVFDAKEWELLGYIRDVLRFYDVGPGSVSTMSGVNLAELEDRS
jgi:hypothetical protein